MAEAMGGNDDGRASKKIAANPYTSLSSVDQVLSNDDLFIEILLLLPLFSLNLFKLVSKHWLSLITAPSFISRRTDNSVFDPPSGLLFFSTFLSFHSRKFSKRSLFFTYTSETGITPLRYKRSPVFTYIPDKCGVMQSCYGLLFLHYMDHTDHYFVYNPLTTLFKMLPSIPSLFSHRSHRFSVFRMAFDPTESRNYKVVHVGGVIDLADVNGYSVKVHVYSLETGKWSPRDDRFPSPSFFGFEKGIYCNGAFHWFVDRKDDPFHFKLEIVDRLVLTKIQTPLTVEGEAHKDNFDRKLFGSYGCLILICRDDNLPRELSIYEMKNGYSEWSIKYTVNLDNLLRRSWKLPKLWTCNNIHSIFFGRREQDSFMVLELSQKLLQYKFVSESVTKLSDLGKEVGKSGCDDFIPSFANV